MLCGKIPFGDIMENQNDVELFYNFLNDLSEQFTKIYKLSYLEGVNEALNYLLDDTIQTEVTPEDLSMFSKEKAKVSEVTFDKESIRKAYQLAMLQGFKYDQITNAQMTPDSIGIFIAYLIKKLYGKHFPQVLLDPLIGTGNLLATVANHSETPFEVIGIDDDPLMCALSRNIYDALSMKNQVFCQDTISYQSQPVDMIVTDFPPDKVDDKFGYFPYPVIMHHLEHLKAGHYFLALIENRFFEQKQSALFREKLAEKAHLFGLIKLDEGLFKNHPQSILIMKKKIDQKETIDDFLLVDLPSFTDRDAFHKALVKMDQWFAKKEVDVQ